MSARVTMGHEIESDLGHRGQGGSEDLKQDWTAIFRSIQPRFRFYDPPWPSPLRVTPGQHCA